MGKAHALVRVQTPSDYPAYHSISNGLIECFRSQVKAALKSQPGPAQWTEELPIVLLSIHTALNESIKLSPVHSPVQSSPVQSPGFVVTRKKTCTAQQQKWSMAQL